MGVEPELLFDRIQECDCSEVPGELRVSAYSHAWWSCDSLVGVQIGRRRVHDEGVFQHNLVNPRRELEGTRMKRGDRLEWVRGERRRCQYH